MKRARQLWVGLMALGAGWLCSASAFANGFDSGTVGAEQFARGGAWVARANTPLATFYNPAALARNPSAIELSASMFFQKTCFERMGVNGQPLSVGSQTYGTVCAEQKPFINPQLAVAFRITPKLGIGFAVLGPAAVGKNTWPDTTTNTINQGPLNGSTVDGPSPSRYILTEIDSLIIWPTLGIGYEVAKNFRVGVSFIWGMGILKFGNMAMGLNDKQELVNGQYAKDSGTQDLRATLQSKDLFVPGFVASAMYTLGKSVDLAGWFHYSDDVRASGEAEIKGFVYNNRLTPSTDQFVINTNPGQTSVRVPQPWRARLGVRYFQLRKTSTNVQEEEAADQPINPMRDELFDIELDGIYANDSHFDYLEIRFNGVQPMIPIGGGIEQPVPPNADVDHKWKNSFGARLGGTWNALPDQLAIHAGSWFQSSSIQPRYVHLDFLPSQRLGLAMGATYRIKGLDISAGYSHIFFQPINNRGNGAIRGLTGQANSNPANRTDFAVNGGRVSASSNIVTLGAMYRFLHDVGYQRLAKWLVTGAVLGTGFGQVPCANTNI
jgi:long-subunit fatty acid transport protein